ncbi:hypothetical protein K2173_012921 [Erythroxylum novogranatense]|uniref:50S ribosomal protein L16, chloroplastic n=1 Tax=Erythroxylum novogranatense TaxID=1862640 RepID=A0AAV8S585_9ROSI|nr:hypothetical protein K2173_012921 [Erythroxylum novogranatense]
MALAGLTRNLKANKKLMYSPVSGFQHFIQRSTPEMGTLARTLSTPLRGNSSATATSVQLPFSVANLSTVLCAETESSVNLIPSLGILPNAIGTLRDSCIEVWTRVKNKMWVHYMDFFIANYNPQHLKFPKQRRGTIKGVSSGGGNHICFGNFGLQALEPAWITSKQIEAGRRAMTQLIRRGGGKIWIRTVPHKSVTAKPTEVRMGRGKGAIKYWVAVVKPGKVLYEVGGVHENIAREAITLAASKMPIQTRFVVSRIR